jgi:hypothetical protein
MPSVSVKLSEPTGKESNRKSKTRSNLPPSPAIGRRNCCTHRRLDTHRLAYAPSWPFRNEGRSSENRGRCGCRMPFAAESMGNVCSFRWPRHPIGDRPIGAHRVWYEIGQHDLNLLVIELIPDGRAPAIGSLGTAMPLATSSGCTRGSRAGLSVVVILFYLLFRRGPRPRTKTDAGRT